MRRQKRNKKIKNKKIRSKNIVILFYLFVFLIIALSIFIFVKVNSLSKFIYINNAEENVEIIVVDPDSYKLVKVLIPGSSQIKASRGLGIYKIASIWKLGEKEGYNGGLLAESIRKNFLLPISYWKNGHKTNLNIWQRIRVFLIEKRILNYNVSEVNLAETKVLKEKQLNDGTSGFIIVSKIPESILVNFVESSMAETVSKIEIEDLTGDIDVTEDVSKILGIMGAKITSYQKGFDKDLDCEVIGKDKFKIKVVARTFNCKETIDETLLVDLKIRLGKRFADRF